MAHKKIIPFINGENEIGANIIRQAEEYAYAGADELFIYNYSKIESEREEFLSVLKAVGRTIDIPFMAGMYMARFEDVKKAFYTGAGQVVMKYEICPGTGLIKEAVGRFGSGRILIEVDGELPFEKISFPVDTLLLKHVDTGPLLEKKIRNCGKKIIVRDSLLRNDLQELMRLPSLLGVSTNYFEGKNLFRVKTGLKNDGIDVNTFESAVDFSAFNTDSAGLVPCVVQDYRTGQVLMLAYMNEESYQATCETGKMTYFSRSRQKLWCKGETSGHYQYVKELFLDCDSDTLLAKVHQIGPACHTGNYTCFFQELAKKDYSHVNPLTVLEDDFNVIMRRKTYPKEGSYTNYLFTKGIDKILKKCGEEAAEIIIAAKNPDAEELNYEIADFLYHVMVLMAERGLTWEDVTRELANRRK